MPSDCSKVILIFNSTFSKDLIIFDLSLLVTGTSSPMIILPQILTWNGGVLIYMTLYNAYVRESVPPIKQPYTPRKKRPTIPRLLPSQGLFSPGKTGTANVSVSSRRQHRGTNHAGQNGPGTDWNVERCRKPQHEI